jgi:hypothetical protein
MAESDEAVVSRIEGGEGTLADLESALLGEGAAGGAP